MRKIYTVLRDIIKFMLLSKRSNAPFKEKIQIFKILFFTYIKIPFSKNQAEVTQDIFGFKVSAYDYKTILFLFKEIFLAQDYKFSSSKSNPIIIDCGANIGMAIFYFKKEYPNCNIIAFEPNPYVFKLLKKNIEQNNLTDVELYNIGLSDSEDMLDFFIDANKGSLKGSFYKRRGGNNKIEVKTKTLSSFINKRNVDLVKIDIEGAEKQVIKDLVSNKVLNNSERYIIEYHHKIKGEDSNLSAFLKYFEDNEFEYSLKSNYRKPGHFQDILINFYK